MEKDEIFRKLRAIQGEIKVGKTQRNNFGKYNYRNAEDILAAATPLLVKEGLTMVVLDEMVEVGGRIYVCAKVVIEDVEVGTAYAREPESQSGMAEPQCTGSASSYARKYALNGVFLLDDCADPDSMDNSKAGKPKAKKPASDNKVVDW
jgi:hypothetical protein